MEQDTALLTAMAEIAGVFVGFGALISVTRRMEIEAAQLRLIRAVVTIGLVVVVAALMPVGLARYGIVQEYLWRVSSLIFLVPGVSALMAYGLFGETLSAVQIIGMAVCAGAVLIVTRRPARPA